MTKQEQDNINWLSFAMSLPVDYRDEVFYYNANFKLFGGFGCNDYILLQEDFRTNYTTQYTESEISLLQELVPRFITNPQDFSMIPRLSVEERISIQMDFMAKHHNHADFKVLIDFIQFQNEKLPFVLLYLFSKEPHLKNLIDAWHSHTSNAIRGKIEDFVKLWNIDLTIARLWDIESSQRTIVEIPNQTII